jgi:glycosyltransferase involved in cell wall biosynthesis
MRILFYINSLASGGAERVTVNLANYWAKERWDVIVATLSPLSNDFYRLHPAVRRISINLEGNSNNLGTALWRNLLRVAALRRALRQLRPDIALGIMTTGNVQLALAAWGLHTVRAIGTEHIFPPQVPLGSVWELLRRFSYARLAAVSALTAEGADWLRTNTHARLVAVIPNAATWPLPSQAPHVYPDSLDNGKRRLLLAVGRLDMQKGFDLLVDVFATLVARHPDWDLVILGEGSLRKTLEHQVVANGLEGRVFLPGLVGNVGAWYERAGLYVMSSRFEGFPNTLTEALAYGVPAVSFDCNTGPRDIIRHEVDGLLVPVGDVNGLTNALDRLMSDQALRQRYASRAVEARERFSIERIACLWEALFEKVVG